MDQPWLLNLLVGGVRVAQVKIVVVHISGLGLRPGAVAGSYNKNTYIHECIKTYKHNTFLFI